MERGSNPILAQLNRAKLYSILDLGYVEPENALDIAQQLLDGGIDILQLRGKSQDPEDLIPLAKKIHTLTRKAEVPFIINDHLDVAQAVKSEGLHLGQKDMPIGKARGILGPKVIIGKSTHSQSQALDAVAEGADYIGFGPIFATPTKPNYIPIGIENLEWIHQTVHLPAFCIGGVKLENLKTLVKNGAQRVAMVSALLQAKKIPKYIADTKKILG
jgi:thiamine-phosphate pyrophosphorylase